MSEVIYGPLPPGFLQITETVTVPRGASAAAVGGAVSGPRHGGLLRVQVLQARLAKNYSLLGGRMDPYVKLSVGPLSKSSTICTAGGTEPRWNEMVELPLLPGFAALHVEVYDQRTIGDKMIAWGDIPFDRVDEETPLEDWFHLSGKQGKDKEGVIHLHIAFMKTHATTTSTATEIGAFPSNGVFTQYGATTHHGVTTYGPVPTYAPIIIAQGPYGAQYVVQPQPAPGVTLSQPPAVIQYGPPGGYLAGGMPPGQAAPAPAPQQPQYNAEIIQLKEMFPTLDVDILRSVLVAKNGNFDAAVTELLAMS